jgi:magnesium-transporting ATPase (P-type)
MHQKPNKANTFFTPYDLRWLAETGFISTAVIIAGFAIGLEAGSTTLARTLAFTSSIVVQQFFYLDLQARNHSFFSTLSLKNYLPFIGLLPILLFVIALYIPLFQNIFSVTAPPAKLLFITLALTASALLISELRKRFAHSWYYPQHHLK